MSAIPRTVERPAATSRRLLQYLRTNMAEAIVVYGQVEGDVHTQCHQEGNAAHKQVGGESNNSALEFRYLISKINVVV